ncbi:brain-specific angiogenesis inhibitor 1-associated protein 2 isoform X3 [Cheilinus undulatus]|uniref:brain-specific angiogenesis inhibitor 1-associated protein 2 isoform X3 n=1 Tax=Cheilinus undulatus TaxID=241271 RepID=UPI001BD20FF7|nr:brain-specific angiogenesis inhibitor 1-associated protein 2 isoform X3 [Cheilinus undulatus]
MQFKAGFILLLPVHYQLLGAVWEWATHRREPECQSAALMNHRRGSEAERTMSIMEQFNPCLRNFIAMGKSYEKALTREVLFQMAEVHRQIQIQLEEMLKSFHNELLTELEKKVELDARYLNAALKKYQMEHKSKGESLEKCQAELKKLRRKSQGSKHPSKYGDKEMQYVEAISNKQSELDNYIAEGYKNALSEERRRYCFLVDRQCAVAKNSSTYHTKGKELLSQKIPVWQQASTEPNKLPDRAMFLAQQMSNTAGTLPPGAHHPGMTISEPIPGAKPLPVPPELAALRASGGLGQQRLMGGLEGGMPLMNGTAGVHGGEDYQQWVDAKVAQGKVTAQTQRHGAEVFSNTLPVRKVAPAKSKTAMMETRTLPRSSSMAAGLERNGRTRVQAIFSHAAGDNSTLLSFNEGDVITLLVPEARDGWHYGENEKNRMRGWFPFSYTRVIPENDANSMRQLRVNNLQHGKSSSTGNLLEREDMSLSVPDYSLHSRMAAQSAAALHGRQQRPYSVAVPGFSQQGVEEYEPRFPTSNNPPNMPAVEAPPKPPQSDDEEAEEVKDPLLDEAQYDSLEKALSCPGRVY